VFYAISALIGPYIGAIGAQQGLTATSWASISALVYNGGAIPGYIAAGFLADAIGRKPYMYLMFIGAILPGILAYLARGAATAPGRRKINGCSLWKTPW
jgi:MFS family permease